MNESQKFLIGILIFEILLGLIGVVLAGFFLNIVDAYRGMDSEETIFMCVMLFLLFLGFVVLPLKAINEVRNYYQKPKIVLNIINLILLLPIFAPMALALLYLVYQLRSGNAQKNEIAPEA
ncbi:hypothetical protein ACMXYN_09475 [Neptuniibacter sp. PT8_73]|uniref:hypothetical protein n=1 Tax=Neptuniibacter sp. PT8_73 TaxID=3398206 RepID=UPI0039F4D6BC